MGYTRKATANCYRLLWRAIDALDYWLTHARLSVVDAVCGPEPVTAADQQRKRDREQLQRAFPEIDGEEGAIDLRAKDRLDR